MDLPGLSNFSQPTWNEPDSLANAFERVLKAYDSESALQAGSKLRYATGNDHCGVSRSVILAALPKMEEILRNPAAGDWPKSAIVDSLIDFWCAFHPEPDFELYQGQALEMLVQQQIEAMVPLIESIAEESGAAASRSAREFLREFRR